jgi:small subunit ribosomal protein S18
MAENENKFERRRRSDGPRRRKVCEFCSDKTKQIDYKDTIRLRKFISERGKILPRRMKGTCAQHQHQLAIAIKRARVMALLPYSID